MGFTLPRSGSSGRGHGRVEKDLGEGSILERQFREVSADVHAAEARRIDVGACQFVISFCIPAAEGHIENPIPAVQAGKSLFGLPSGERLPRGLPCRS